MTWRRSILQFGLSVETPMRRLLVRLFGVIAILAANLLLVGLMVMQVLAVGVDYGAQDSLILCALGVLAGIALAIAHELGHLIIGLAVGLPFARLTLGMLAVVREEHRLRIRLNSKWFQPTAYVLMASHEAQTWRVAAMIAAGPAINMLIAAVRQSIPVRLRSYATRSHLVGELSGC